MRFKVILHHLINLTFRFYQHKYSKEWDEALLKLINESESISFKEYTVVFNFNNKLYEVWVGNEFYSYAHLYRINDYNVEEEAQYRPSLKAMDKLDKFVKENKAQQELYKTTEAIKYFREISTK